MACKEIKWIWFDLDDTLYDFAGSSLIALRKMYDAYNLGRYFADAEQWIDLYHKHNYRLWDLYNHGLTDQPTLRHDRFYLPLTEGGAPADEAEAMVPGLDRDYLDALAATGLLLPGAKQTLEQLRREGYRIGLLSNGFKDVQYNKLRTAGIDRLIDCVVLSDEAGVTKPDARIYRFAEQKAGTEAAECVMVGDNPETDIAGAIAAGWQAILYATTPQSDSTQAPCPTLKSLPALPDLLNK